MGKIMDYLLRPMAKVSTVAALSKPRESSREAPDYLLPQGTPSGIPSRLIPEGFRMNFNNGVVAYMDMSEWDECWRLHDLQTETMTRLYSLSDDE